MDRIVLEGRFTTHQKLVILLGIGSPLLIIILTLLIKLPAYNFIGYFVLLFFLSIYSVLVAIAFMKRGFYKKNSKLYKASFINKKVILKSKIILTNKPKLSILKFKKYQKYAWFNVANPDMTSEFNSFEINILSENHTIREPILFLKNENNANNAVTFLTENFSLENEIFSPDFSTGIA